MILLIGSGLLSQGTALISDIGGLFGDGDETAERSTAENGILRGDWDAIIARQGGIDCSAQQLDDMATLLAAIYRADPSAGSSDFRRLEATEDLFVNSRDPATPREIANTMVWFACNGWGGSGSDINPVESTARDIVQSRLGNELPTVSESSSLSELAGAIRDFASEAEQVAAGIEGAESGIESGVARERIRQQAGAIPPLVPIVAVGALAFFVASR